QRGAYQYRVAWLGYPIYPCTWEPTSTFTRQTLDEFWTRKKARPDFIPMPDSDIEVDTEVLYAHSSDARLVVLVLLVPALVLLVPARDGPSDERLQVDIGDMFQLMESQAIKRLAFEGAPGVLRANEATLLAAPVDPS
ncbi:hypothetical protein V8E36_000733, partial [Tilletia maclaganii]